MSYPDIELEEICVRVSFSLLSHKCGNERLLSQYNILHLPSHMATYTEYTLDVSTSLIVDADVLIGLSIKSP